MFIVNVKSISIHLLYYSIQRAPVVLSDLQGRGSMSRGKLLGGGGGVSGRFLRDLSVLIPEDSQNP